ncbi:hypothetical protein BDN71DRAFT_1429945 [Pleurotus eryngii]|uniref:Oxidoreductase AflY n=1 Tax=Pleurotus eryngii TaxID=5323 RepID=A0A9P6A2C4_PLEER|nr:hypothetical protein BDN71DRAFT_1429945 [Pleurotus eryngii]
MTSTFELFPDPAPAPSPISPFRWAGISPQTTAALRETLQANHEKWHIFFNDRRFHNHGAHAIIAAWVLGADADIIRAVYQHSADYQRPAFKSPAPITLQNFHEHLGKEEYYNSYLEFFKGEVQAKGFSSVLEEFVFAEKSNFSGDAQPQMLNRFMSGLVHPLIHTGYGAELGLPGMIVEGLAQTAVHEVDATKLVPPSAFSPATSEHNLITRLASMLVLDNRSISKPSTTSGVHAFTILARLLKDPKFDVKKIGKSNDFQYLVDNLSEPLLKILDDWAVDASDPKGVEKKIEEIILTNVLLYALPGWKEGQDFKANFFTMHLVTSSLFLSSLVPYLGPASQALFLKSYFAFSLAWYLSRGAPALDIPGFFAADTLHPAQPGTRPTPWEGALGSPATASNPNPWLPIIQNSIISPDEHVPKLQRALAHYSAIYGSRRAGEGDLKDTELEGADKVDGSLFIRAAGLTDKRMGRIHSGEKANEFWDREF